MKTEKKTNPLWSRVLLNWNQDQKKNVKWKDEFLSIGQESVLEKAMTAKFLVTLAKAETLSCNSNGPVLLIVTL